jgi:hypothetical protein
MQMPSQTLQRLASTLPHMSSRAHDVIDIIWCMWENIGIDPAAVAQVWSLDQGLMRLPKGFDFHTKGSLADMAPYIPGFSLEPDDKKPVVCPCVLPSAKLWVNHVQRFMSGAEMMQVQGMMMSDLRDVQGFSNRQLAALAGNSFAMPAMGAHITAALARICMRFVEHTLPQMAVDAFSSAASSTAKVECGLVPPTVQISADTYVKLLSQLAPCLCDTALDQTRVEVAVGTLCSGTDHVVLMAKAIAAAFEPHGLVFKVTVTQTFRCELKAWVRKFAAANMGNNANIFCDVTALPLSRMRAVDLLICGFSCQSLSSMNATGRALIHTDAISGRTWAGCHKYIEYHRPRVILIENVLGIRNRIAKGKKMRGQDANMTSLTYLMKQLSELGYAVGFHRINAVNFLVPQRRNRIYIWAEQVGDAHQHAHIRGWWDAFVKSAKSKSTVPLEKLLLA